MDSLNQAGKAVGDKVNQLSETVQGKGAEASAEQNKSKHTARSGLPIANTADSSLPPPPGVAKDTNAGVGTQATAAKDYLVDKKDQKSHEVGAPRRA